MLASSSETTAAPRIAHREAAPRDNRPAATGFSSLIDDSATKPAPPRPRDAETAPAEKPSRSRGANASDDRPTADAADPSAPDNAAISDDQAIRDPKTKSGIAQAAKKIAVEASEDSASAPDANGSPDAAPTLASATADPVAAPPDSCVEAAIPVVPVIPAAQAPTSVAPASAPPPLTIAAAGIAAAGISAQKEPAVAANAGAATTTAVGDTETTTTVEAVRTGIDTEKSKTAKNATQSVAVKSETGFETPSLAQDLTEAKGETAAIPAPEAAKSNIKVAGTSADVKPSSKEPVSPDDAAPTNPAAALPQEHRGLAAPAPSADSLAQPSGTPVLPQTPAIHAAAPTPAAPLLTATVAPTLAVPLSGVAVELAAKAQSGVSRFEIRLDPADLGRIDVRIDVDRQGQVTSHLTVEKPETLAMLRQDAPQLHRALNDAGLKTADGGLQFTLGDQSQSRQNGDPAARQTQRIIIRDDDTSVRAAPVRNYGRLLGSSGGIDIRV